MNSSSVSLLLFVSCIGLFILQLKTARAQFTEPIDGRRQNLRQGGNRDEIIRRDNGDKGIENVETTRSLIIGGKNAENYPRSIVFFSDRVDDLQCGGTLISPTVVLAAGHCQISLVHEAVFLRYDYNDASDDLEDTNSLGIQSEREIRIKVKEEILHPQYNPKTLHNDVMLLVLERSPNEIDDDDETPNPSTKIFDDENLSNKLDKDEDSPTNNPLTVPYMQLQTPDSESLQDLVDAMENNNNGDEEKSRFVFPFISNPNNPKTTDLQLKAFGWGHTANGDLGEPSETLQEVTLNYVSNEECKKAAEGDHLSYGDRLTDDMMCTWRSTMDTCHGDSGGPVVIENPNYKKNDDNSFQFIQVGIVSWGEDCADEIFPGGT
jgi:secreted trypsin-like serine protease